MKIEKIEEPCLHRRLNMNNNPVLVTLGKPKQNINELDYYCPYLIEWDSNKKFGYAFGVDSVQAMQLAMKKISIDLDFISQSSGFPISWLSDEIGKTGFN